MPQQQRSTHASLDDPQAQAATARGAARDGDEDEGLSEGEEDEVEEQGYSQSAEWADIQPEDAPLGQPVAAVQYLPDHKELLGYFRAVLAKGELSPRVLRLTADVVHYNQADYTAWQLRWQCLQHLRQDLRTEYAFTDSIMKSNAKNYQLWNHRRKCALALGPGAAQRELDVAAAALAADPKNYHAWAHRQALVQAFGGELWAQELAFSEACVEQDVRNNSAWAQRALIMQHQVACLGAPTSLQRQAPAASSTAAGAAAHSPLSATHTGAGSQPAPLMAGQAGARQQALQQLMLSELEYVAVQVAKAPRNESVWNYLRGLFRLPGVPPHTMASFPQVHLLCSEALLAVPSCPPALALLSEFYLHAACQAARHLAWVQRQLSMAGADRAASQHASSPVASASTGAAALLGVQPPTAPSLAQAAHSSQAYGQTPAEPTQRAGGGAWQGVPTAMPITAADMERARSMVRESSKAVLVLCNHLMVADPVRTMLWLHRQQDAEALMLACGVAIGPAAAGTAMPLSP